MKKRMSLIMAIVMVASALVGCGGNAAGTTTEATSEATSGSASSGAASDALVLTYADVNSADSLDGLVANYFKEQVETLSDGSMTVDVQLSGVLGSEDDILSTMTIGGGTVDLCRISMSALTNYGGKKSQLVSVPYTFENRDHFWNFTNSEVGKEILGEAEELGLGVKGLFYMEEGFRNFFFVDEVKGLEDLKNKKIRVNSDPVMTEIVEALDANATVISSGEMYSALQSGIVDGADQPTALYESQSFYEVAPHLIEDGHIMSVSEVVVSDARWSQLSDDQKKVIEDAGAATSKYCQEQSEKMENECKERLADKDINVIPVDDKQPWIDACSDLISSKTTGYEDVYKEIVATK